MINQSAADRCRSALILWWQASSPAKRNLQPGRLPPQKQTGLCSRGQVRVRLDLPPQKNSFVVVAGVSPALAKAAKTDWCIKRRPQRRDLDLFERASLLVTFCTRDPTTGFLILKKRKLLSKPTLEAGIKEFGCGPRTLRDHAGPHSSCSVSAMRILCFPNGFAGLKREQSQSRRNRGEFWQPTFFDHISPQRRKLFRKMGIRLSESGKSRLGQGI